MKTSRITQKVIDEFLNSHPDKPFSAAKLHYSLYLEPEIEEQAKNYAMEMEKTEEDLKYEKVIADTEEPEELLGLMRKNMSGLNRDALRKKILEKEAEMLPYIQKKVRNNGQDVFIEHALHFFLHSRENYCEWILKEYSSLRSEYLKSSLCLVLGFRGELDLVPFLMKETERFEREYPDDNYEQAPLLAVQELGVRFLG